MVNALNCIGVVLVFLLGVIGEFRFCHYGPQRVKNSECPYGVFFDSSISTSCGYYANDGTGLMAEAELNRCQGSPTLLSSAGQRSNATSFQAVFLEVPDPTDSGAAGKLEGDCVEECFDQWVPLSEQGGGGSSGPVVESEPFYDYKVEDAPGPNNKFKSYDKDYHSNLTAQVFLELLDEEDPEENRKATYSYVRSVSLLKKSFEIMQKVCTPYITKAFTDQLFKGFLFFVSKSNDEVLDIGEMEKQEILKALNKCSGKKKMVQIFANKCENYSRIIGYGDPNSGEEKMTTYKIFSKSFHWLKYDPIIEGAWAAIDFVHGYCFNEHLPDFNYHHIYQVGLEGLFTKMILQRWPFPPKLSRGDGYWNNILDTLDAKLMMQNLDACVNAGYFGSVHQKRLNRPFSKFPQLGVNASTTTTPKPKGPEHLQNAAKYWDWYERNKAWETYLNNVGGTCITSEDKLNEYRKQLENICSNQR